MASSVSTIESAAIYAADTDEYPVDPDDGSWFTATRRRKPNTTTNSALEPLPAKNQATPRPPPLPVDDFKVLFRPQGGLRLSDPKSKGKSEDRALDSLNNTPGTASKTSTTTVGLIPQKNRAASVERPESPPAKKPVLAGQTPPTKVSWAAGPPSLKSSLPDSYHPPSSLNHPNVPLTFNAHNCTKQELQDALTKLRDSLKAEVTSMITQTIHDFRAELRDMLKAHAQALVKELKQHNTRKLHII
ncbi:hypothetical protein HPB51_007554 [Rhipicephalus microplus]|uniref:Uncharacterized protein n=1 Tax=Rhipicephalus microplus TaxID=6941 RepID=A0A9J6EYP0_RHIMP|nr:hypothetical protein HPB51_007554 [Rhipicephalus microplus]